MLCRNVSMSMTTPSHWKVKQSVRLIATGENTPWPGLNIIQERYVNILVQFFPRGPYIVFCFFSIFSPPSTLQKDNVSEKKFECNVLRFPLSSLWRLIFCPVCLVDNPGLSRSYRRNSGSERLCLCPPGSSLLLEGQILIGMNENLCRANGGGEALI